MTAPDERAGCEHAGPGYWGWWCRDCHSISVSQARAKFAQEDMLDQLAIHRRRQRADTLRYYEPIQLAVRRLMRGEHSMDDLALLDGWLGTAEARG